jgi:hypothetical protein
MWVPETSGSVAYLHAHGDLPSKLVAGVNLDMVGQDQELCRSTLNLDRTPDSLPSYLNDFVFNLVEKSVKEFDKPSSFGSTSTFRYGANAFSGGSDHAEFNDSTIAVPCIMLLQWPDLYYHTSMDTIDKVSADSLKRVGWIATVAALTLANATSETAFLLADQTASRGMARIEEPRREAVEEFFKKKSDEKFRGKQEDLAKELLKTAWHYRNKIEHIAWREQQAVKSVKRLGESEGLDAFLHKSCEDIAGLGKKEIMRIMQALNFVAEVSGLTIPAKLEETEAIEGLGKLVPKRLFKGTFDTAVLKKELGEKEFEWYQEMDKKDVDLSKKVAEVLNFMDGRRSVYDIVKAVSAEYSETDPKHIMKFLRDMEKVKLVAFQ